MDNQPNNQDLKSQILDRIESEAVSPRARWFFNTQEGMVWALWLFSVIVGALAVAVTLFVVISRNYSLYEATHESFLTFAIEFIPYLWIIIFAAMAGFAVYGLRHTKTGYRYPLWQIFGSSFLLSIVGGLALHVAGVGFMLDHQIGRLTPQYMSQEKMEQNLWQRPEQGRLVGSFIEVDNGDVANVVIFEDINGVRFETNISELPTLKEPFYEAGDKVRLLGQLVSLEPPVFHACAALPWFFETDHTLEELREMRDKLREEIQGHFRSGSKRMLQTGETQNASSSLAEGSLCEKIPALKRMLPRVAR